MTKYEYSILPEYAPLYPKLPYRYTDYEKVSLYCRGDKEKCKSCCQKNLR